MRRSKPLLFNLTSERVALVSLSFFFLSETEFVLGGHEFSEQLPDHYQVAVTYFTIKNQEVKPKI